MKDKNNLSFVSKSQTSLDPSPLTIQSVGEKLILMLTVREGALLWWRIPVKLKTQYEEMRIMTQCENPPEERPVKEQDGYVPITLLHTV